MMSSREPIRLAKITDGLSNTIMLGETIGWIVEGERHGLCSWATGGLARGRGMIPWMLETHPNPEHAHWRHLGNWRYSMYIGFGSMHPELVNFTMGDGSTRSVSRDIHWKTLYALCGARDGQVVVVD